MSELMTVKEVAHRLRVDDTTVRRWIVKGVLEAVTLPKSNVRNSYRIKRETVEKVINGDSTSIQ